MGILRFGAKTLIAALITLATSFSPAFANFAYVATAAFGAVSVIDTSTNTVVTGN